MRLEKRFNSLSHHEEGKVTGYALLWDNSSFVDAIGRKEKFKRGSLKLNRSGVPLYFQHNKEKLLANSKSDTLKIKEDEKGLWFEATLPQNAKLIRELCKRGDVQGASVGFYAKKESHKDGIREIEDAVLDEISLVCRPAHESSVAFRSQDKHKKKWSDLLWTY